MMDAACVIVAICFIGLVAYLGVTESAASEECFEMGQIYVKTLDGNRMCVDFPAHGGD